MSAVIAGVLLASSTLAADLAIPDMLGRWNNRPVWVAAESAVDSTGRPNAALLGEYIAVGASRSAKENTRQLARQRNAGDDCVSFALFRTDHFKSTSSLDALVANAEVIVAGTVLSQRQGVLYDTPGTLLLLSADYLKGQSTPVTYLFYPYGDIKTADGLFCSRPSNSDPRPPSVGDRFIAFSLLKPYVADGFTILLPDPNKELLRETADGKVTLPVALRSEGTSATFDAVRGRIGKIQQGFAK